MPRNVFPILLSCAILLLPSCVSSGKDSSLLNAEPAIDSVLSSAPRTLRLYFSSLPQVAVSEVKLIGSSGEVELRGLHTMAANDLMMEVAESLGDGTYQVEWQTTLAEDDSPQSGSYSFSVKRD